MDPYERGDASVTYPDWGGTAALEHKMTGTRDLYDLTGIDPEEWLIIGLDLGGGKSFMDTHVIAVRRAELGDQHLSERSHVDAVDIRVHDVDPFDLLREMTNMLDIRMRVRAVKNATIMITDLADQPPQPD